MNKYPVKLADRIRAHPVHKKHGDAERNAVDVLPPETRTSSFLSFRYSYTEMSVFGGKAHVKSRNARFEGGKLTSETFEGELDRSAYDQTVSDAQRRIVEQTGQFLRSFSLVLPFFRTRRPDRD
jgi:hypothetical protein